MTQILSIEFLVVVLCILNLFLFILLGIIVKRVNRIRMEQGEMTVPAREPDTDRSGEAVTDSAKKIMDMLLPLVQEAQEAAASFETQLGEKRRLSKTLNDAIDSRIISINLLLSRAETLHKRLEKHQHTLWQSVPAAPSSVSASGQVNVVDQQNQIIDLYLQKMDPDTISQRLSIPKGEVKLVIDLKEKFMAMEQAE